MTARANRTEAAVLVIYLGSLTSLTAPYNVKVNGGAEHESSQRYADARHF